MRHLDAGKLTQEELMKELRKDGDILVSNCLGQRYLGCALKKGHLILEGTPGNGMASYLDGASIYVKGNVQDAVADTMNDGLVAVEGNAGDALAYAMRGGKVYILGDTGYRAGVHMKAYKDRQSTLIIGGSAGSFLGEYLAGGTIVVLGLNKKEGEQLTGFFCANGMYAGKIYLRSETKPLNLSDKLSFRAVDEEEKETTLAPLVRDFASTFSLNAEDILKGKFSLIEADPKKSYKQLYASL